MLKINLLPAYIYEKRKVRKTIILFGLIFLLTVGGVAGWWIFLINKQKDLTAQVNDMEAKANQVTTLEGKIAAEKSAIAATKAKTDYIEAVMAYNIEAVKLYEELAKYTYSRIQYKGITPSASSLAISAHARTLGDCGRYLLNMYRATSIFSGITIGGIPEWKADGSSAGGFDFTLTGTLVKSITPPTYAAGGGSATTTPAPGTAGTTPPSPAPAPKP